MKRRLIAALALIAPMAAHAGGISVTDAWSPAAPPAARAHAGFFTLVNDSVRPRSLVGVAAPGYAMARIHESRMIGGVMTMTRVDRLEIPAGAQVVFRPGGLHLMLFGINTPMTEGTEFPLTLGFDQAGEVVVTVIAGQVVHRCWTVQLNVDVRYGCQFVGHDPRVSDICAKYRSNSGDRRWN